MAQGKKILESWDKGNIIVSSIRNFGYCNGSGSRQIDSDYGFATVIDLSSEILEVYSRSAPSSAIISAISTDRDITYDWTTDINNINQYIYWIWGGITSGGVGILKENGGGVAFIVSHGYYIHNSTGKGRYYTETFYRISNPNNLANDLSQVAFYYYNQAQKKTNLINPFPSDNYDAYIYIVTNNGPNNNTSDTEPFCYWNLEGSGTTLDPYKWVPENWYYSSDDLNTIFQKGEIFHTDIAHNTREYLPHRVVRYSGGGSILNAKFLDDEFWGLANYTHQSGNWFGQEVDDEDDQGDGGDKDDTQDPPIVPSLDDLNGDATETGFVRIYKPTLAELRGLANYMFSNITDADATQLKKLLSNPLDYIIGLNMCHFIPAVGTYENDVKIGGLSIGEGLGMYPVEKQYITISGGSISLVGQIGNYLDYEPFTKIKIFIPYTGMHDLPTDLVQNSTLTLTYIIDLLSGALVAHLSITKDPQFNGEADATSNALVFTYTGNCFTPIPIANADYRGAVNGMLGLCGGAISSAVSGNPMALFKAGTSAIMNAKPTIQSKASVANDFGFMSGQIAYLIVSRPIESKPSKYYDWVGHMCNRIEPVSYYEGGVLTIKDDSLWTSFNNTNITDTEAQEIRDLFKLGVYV